MIPKIIWQTSHNDSYDDSWVTMNPSWEVRRFSDSDMERFFESYGDGCLLPVYQALALGCMKADLWRYCTLEVFGGLYADADTVCMQPIDEWLPECKFWVTEENNKSWFCQWVFASEPHHAILSEVIKLCKANVIAGTKYVGEHAVHAITGPSVFTQAILNIHECVYEQYNSRKVVESTIDRQHFGVVIGSSTESEHYPVYHSAAGHSGWKTRRFERKIMGPLLYETRLYKVADVDIYAQPILTSMLHSIIAEDEYVVRCISKLHKDDLKVVVDVGANAGSFSMLAAKIFPNARIISIEPNPNMLSILQRNRDEFAKQLEVHPVACGNIEGTMRFVDTLWRDQGSGGGFCVELVNNRKDIFWDINTEKTRPATEVNVTKLSKILEESKVEEIDILKLDCEGGEYSVVDDLEATGWLRKTKWIRGEYHAGAESTNRMLQQLSHTHIMHLTAYSLPLQDGGRLGRFIGHRVW